MAKHLICPDVSEFQVPLDRTYTRDFVIFRVMFGAHYLDPKFLANAAAAKRLHDEGRIAGALLYVVYTSDPVRAQFEAAWDAIGPRIPRWLTGIMIDVETWRGKSYALAGDHSKRINHLYGLHAHRLDNWNAVIAYGNAGDLHELYPKRDRRCRVIVASYGSSLSYRNIRGAIGQQYSDGQARYRVPRLGGRRLPRRSEPFGHCDHNVFPGIASGRELVRLLRPEQLDPHAAAKAAPKRPRRKPAPKKAAPKKAVAKKVAPKKAAGTHPTATNPMPAKHPVPAVKPVPAKKPAATKRAAKAAVTTKTRNALVSHNGAHTLIIRDDGSVEVRHRIDPHAVSPGEH